MKTHPRYFILPLFSVVAAFVVPACSDPSSSSSGTTNAESSSSSSGGESNSSSVSSSGNSSSGNGGVGGMGVGGQGGSGGAAMALGDLSDSFDGSMLSSDWLVYRPEVLAINVSGGALSLHLTQQALWYNASRGPLVYKFVTGNFKVTSRVRVRKASNPAANPSNPVHLAGLMARNPQGEMAGANENYVFVVAGFDENDLSVETKSTVDSVSAYEGPTWPSADAELRLCRIGNSFHLYKRMIGAATFTLAKTYDRPDLPAKLQVGANIYSASAPDLAASFDEVTFAEAASEADCAAN